VFCRYSMLVIYHVALGAMYVVALYNLNYVRRTDKRNGQKK
jgi:hypothetical protein